MLNDANAQSNSDWRISMLARGAGFPILNGADDFGLAFSGPALNGKVVSIKCLGANTFAMRVPAAVSQEMRLEAAVKGFLVDDAGIVLFRDVGDLGGETIRRAAALIRALPNTPLAVYRQKTESMPSATEAERQAKVRIGQDVFRSALDDYWQGCCAVTGIPDRALLRASHIKGWAECETDEERLDVHNGLLLAVHVDAAFDAKLITFSDEGAIVVSHRLSARSEALIKDGSRCVPLTADHEKYLLHHRRLFEQADSQAD